MNPEQEKRGGPQVFVANRQRAWVWPLLGLAAFAALLAGGYAWYSHSFEKAPQEMKTPPENTASIPSFAHALALARAAQRKNDWERVVSILEGALASEGAETEPRRAEAEELLAQSRTRLADRQTAEDKLSEARRLLADDNVLEARAALNAAKMLWPDAPKISELEKLLQESDFKLLRGTAENLRAQARAIQPNLTHSPQANWGEAARLNREAAALFEKIGDTYTQAKCLHELAFCLQPDNNPAGDWKLAFDNYKRANELLGVSLDKEGIALSLAQTGFNAMPGRFEGATWPEARGYFQRALDIYTELGNKKGMSFSLHQLGWCIQPDNNPEFGNWATAAQYFERAAEMRGEIGDQKGQAQSLFQQAYVLAHDNRKNNTEQSRALFQQAAQLRRAAGDENGAADAERWGQAN